jgi:hypothetical protein
VGPAAAGSPGRGIEALWLDVLQRITSRAAHELKGALNGASVNLEVVRSRAEGNTGGMDRVARYATAAATQLDAVIAMSDAVLALARAPRESTAGAPGEEVATLLRRMVALIAPALRIDERTLMVAEPIGALDTRAVPTMLVRAIVGSALLAATERWQHTRCAVDTVGNRIVVERHESALADEAVSMEQEMLDAAADAGIQVLTDGSAITMTIPRGNAVLGTGLAS